MAGVSFQFSAQDYPECPGCYLMKESSGRIIYVGKANNLRQRIGSYFRSPEQLPAKTQVMMGRVEHIDVLCTHSEKEALLLEASLIKKHRPRYNIVLRDDKSYILFKLDKNDPYPRLSLTRRVAHNGSVYFGPFTSALAARQTLKVINRLFALRKCKNTTFRNRTRPCLQYHMNRCLGPCVYEVDAEQYAQLVRHLELFLSGRSKELVSRLREEMYQASQDLAFEKAALLRDQIKSIQRTVEQQTVVLPEGDDCDAVALAETDSELIIGLAFVRQGMLLDYKTFFWEHDPDLQARRPVDQAPGQDAQVRAAQSYNGQDILRTVLLQFYTQDKFIPAKIILPFQLADQEVEAVLAERRGGPVQLVPAWRQRDKKIVDLARTNAVQSRSGHNSGLLARSLADKLGRQEAVQRVEGVDVSHLGGQGVVVGQVVFENGRSRPDAYRVYTFPELEGSRDDYAALAAWATRRLRSGPPWPDLVLIDGGKGQLAAVQRAFQEGQTRDEEPKPELALAALAKGSRRKGELEERVFVPERKNPLNLRPGSRELLFLQHVRDAAHRFVLSRQKRSRTSQTLDSNLEAISGIGPRTARLLWDRFGSVQAMAQAGPEDLETIPGIGPKKAGDIHAALQELVQNLSVTGPT